MEETKESSTLGRKKIRTKEREEERIGCDKNRKEEEGRMKRKKKKKKIIIKNRCFAIHSNFISEEKRV